MKWLGFGLVIVSGFCQCVLVYAGGLYIHDLLANQPDFWLPEIKFLPLLMTWSLLWPVYVGVVFTETGRRLRGKKLVPRSSRK